MKRDADAKPKVLLQAVFDGDRVRRNFKPDVINILTRVATSSSVTFAGTMLSSSEGRRWVLPGGVAQRTPSRWGHESTLTVSGHEAKELILSELQTRKDQT